NRRADLAGRLVLRRARGRADRCADGHRRRGRLVRQAGRRTLGGALDHRRSHHRRGARRSLQDAARPQGVALRHRTLDARRRLGAAHRSHLQRAELRGSRGHRHRVRAPVCTHQRSDLGAASSVIPYRDENPTSRFAWVTLGLILVNAFAFLFIEPATTGDQGAQQAYFLCHAEIPYEVTHQTSLAQGGPAAAEQIAKDYGISPGQAAQAEADLGRRCPNKSWLGSVFAAMFLHVGWLHIAGNMLYLWIFGNNVEDRLGRFRYLIFYLAGGIAAAALQLAFGPNSTVPNLGASGAIAAVLG